MAQFFRQSRFLSAGDFVQTDRLRRKVAIEMARVFSEVDLLLVPSLRDEMLTITNFTGHPSLTLRAGFVEVSEARSDWAPDPAHPLPRFSPPRRVPHGVTLIGWLFEEGTLGRAGIAMERAFGVADQGLRVLSWRAVSIDWRSVVDSSVCLHTGPSRILAVCAQDDNVRKCRMGSA